MVELEPFVGWIGSGRAKVGRLYAQTNLDQFDNDYIEAVSADVLVDRGIEIPTEASLHASVFGLGVFKYDLQWTSPLTALTQEQTAFRTY